jgi:hypothetical protein
MVIASGRASQESALKYMKTMLDIYQNTYRVMTPPLNPFEFMQRKGTAEAPPEPPATNGKAAEAAPAPEVQELKQRVSELEAMVANLASPKKTKGRGGQRKTRTS